MQRYDTIVDRGEILFWYQTYYAVFQQNIQDVPLSGTLTVLHEVRVWDYRSTWQWLVNKQTTTNPPSFVFSS